MRQPSKTALAPRLLLAIAPIVAVVCTVCVTAALPGTMARAADATSTTDPPSLTVPESGGAPAPETTNDFLDLDRELSECVGNSNAKPGCGREPVRSGDRGGAMQWAVFAVMIGGIGFIGWRIIAGSRRAPVSQ